MTESTNPDAPARGHDDPRGLASRVESLEHRLACLAGLLEHREERERRPVGAEATPESGANLAEALELLTSIGVARLARRLGDQEARSAGLARMVERHEEAIRLLCLALKELDDPYGLGAGLDERIGLDEGARERDEEAGT